MLSYAAIATVSSHNRGLANLHLEAGHHVTRQEEEEEHLGRHPCAGRCHCGWEGTPPPGPVAERRVAAGDANRVQPAGAELLVTRGGDKTRPRGRARLPIVDACTRRQKPKVDQDKSCSKS